MRPINLVTIIDDDKIVCFLEQKIIERSHLVNQIKVFSNGLEAMDFLKANAGHPDLLPDIILLDLNMPIMGGWAFLEEFVITKPLLGKKIVIYIVSSSISPTDIERFKSISDVSNYIIKPITIEKFKEIAKVFIEEHTDLIHPTNP